MRTLIPCLLLLASLALPGQDLSRLPSWAREPAAAARMETPPADADAWVLLKRQEFAYGGKGVLVCRRFRLVRILGQRGLAEGMCRIFNAGGKVQSIRTLKGWNLRPDGELVKLSRSNVRVLDVDRPGESSQGTMLDAGLTRCEVGSLVAFETEETLNYPFGPIDLEYALEDQPVRRWELSCDPGKATPRLTPVHWEAWGLTLEPMGACGYRAQALPALPGFETEHPFQTSILPMVLVSYVDLALGERHPLVSWNSLASWYCEAFREAARPSGQVPVQGAGTKEALTGILAWMDRELTYHITFLSPDRGWLPESGPEVVRRRNGDCKDHAACFLGEARGAGFEGCPVLCAIVEQEVEASPVPNPFTFNHAIAALRLKDSLGLAAEVQTAQGRFLLVDPTDRYCPLGRLPSAHHHGHVLICTPEGAVWADVPEAAPMVPRLQVEVTGDGTLEGRTQARIHLLETANARSLRAWAFQGGENALKERVLRALFKLPATATLSAFRMGDPLDLERPFELSFTVSRAGGLANGNGRCQLEPWGLPASLPSIQKPGVPRRYPVEARSEDILDYHAVWTFPAAVGPVLPALEAETPFADLRWHASAVGATATLDLHLRRKRARFDGDQRETGVAAWKKLRGLVDRVSEDGPGFKLVAP